MSENAATPQFAQLVLPAQSAYLAVLRITAAGLAAREEFTIEAIEDLKMAVGEASALVIDEAESGYLYTTFAPIDNGLRITVGCDGDDLVEVDTDSFGWQMLSALASNVHVTTSDRPRTIEFEMAASAE